MKTVTGNLVDIYQRDIYPAKIKFDNGVILSIERVHDKKFDNYIIPGFVDSHVHIESSMLMPQEFSKLVVPRGTVAVVTDPHEIANVTGVSGVLAMVKNAELSSLCKVFFTIPSCVPSTCFDGSGAVIDSSDVAILANSGKFVGLSEVMDVPSVINEDGDMIGKIEAVRSCGMVVDGHAPLLSGDELLKYAAAGISTDHECVSAKEGEEKIKSGIKILIRWGSAVDNYDGLKCLIADYPDSVMFCTDDSHPDTLLRVGHIDKLVKRAVKDGYNIFDVLRAASLNPVEHYSLPVGVLRVSDSADFQVVKSIRTFEPLQVYVGGRCVYDLNKEEKNSHSQEIDETCVVNVSINKFKRGSLALTDLRKNMICGEHLGIEIVKNQLLTVPFKFSIDREFENFEASLDDDILKLVYLNRYSSDTAPQIAYVRGFNMKRGAIASTISHDSHNILAVGTNDSDLLKAINKVIEYKGGLSYSEGGKVTILPLPIGGIISDRSGEYVNKIFTSLKRRVKMSGSDLYDPFMTLSFLSLIVIPEIKLGERGLFDFRSFSFIEG